MMKHKTTGRLAAVLVAGICTVSFGDALLLDFYGAGTSGNAASSADWSNAGIVEDVTGAAGGTFGGVNRFNIDYVTFSTSAGVKQYGAVTFIDSAVLNGYQYVKNATSSISIGGFDDGAGNANTLTSGSYGLDGNTFTLQTNQNYRLYLFGAGAADNQNTAFTFDGVTKSTATNIIGTAVDAGHIVSFDFTTGADLTGFTLDFTYKNDASEYGALNGLALVAIEVLPMSYAVWATAYPGIGSESNDFDLDLRDNLFEYAVGGDPTVIDTVGDPIFLQTAGGLKYIYNARNDDTNLVVEVETTDDLVGDSWGSGYSVVEGTNSFSALFDEITNGIPTTASETFIRLKVEN